MSNMEMFGRTMIVSDAEILTDENVVNEVKDAMNVHRNNRIKIEYLWDYYRGKQPILNRKKTVRPEICNKIVENRANEIVSFKVGYLCGEPIQYVGRKGKEGVSNAISELNEMMFSVNKASQDKQIVEWQMIAGTAYRMVLPKKKVDEDDAPFEMYTLDPRDTFVVYRNDVGYSRFFGVKYSTDKMNIVTYYVYSHDHYWKIKDDKIIESKPLSIGIMPIFEYPANSARLGAFEIVLDLLDEINNIASNRMDGIEQFVQAFIKFINCDITKEEFKEFVELGAIKVKSTEGANADVDMVSNELNQTQTQITKDDVYNAILTICGMPNRNGGSSTSDTGAAVLLRDGWSLAEARAKDSEVVFKESEQQVLKLILRIFRDTQGLSDDLYALRLSDIDMKFTRRNYDNIQSKSQVLVSMLQQPKIHPRLGFTSCGLFSDPESAYQMSTQYYEEQMSKVVPTPEKDEGGVPNEQDDFDSDKE